MEEDGDDNYDYEAAVKCESDGTLVEAVRIHGSIALDDRPLTPHTMDVIS